MTKIKFIAFFMLSCLAVRAQSEMRPAAGNNFDVNAQLDYCADQAAKTLKMIKQPGVFPRTIFKDNRDWKFIKAADWTSGFWPGILWYIYEHKGDESWKIAADKFTRYLEPLSRKPAFDHDLGFQIFCSYGNAYRLTRKNDYKEVILRTADTLATLYNPRIGTILSWPFRVKTLGGHNTIIDNMMNLEMLIWAAKEKKEPELTALAKRHADVTIQNHFRADYTSYHVIVYNEDGSKKKGITYQGQSDESMWARGQVWAIYGYTMMYKETKKKKYLDFAQKVSNVFIRRLPADLIPYWDFDSPKIPYDTRDASAAAIAASAFLDLARLTGGKKGQRYYYLALDIIMELSSERYQSRDKNSSFLLHSRGSKTSEIDVSINYADYYYIEALLRLKKLNDSLDSAPR